MEFCSSEIDCVIDEGMSDLDESEDMNPVDEDECGIDIDVIESEHLLSTRYKVLVFALN